MAKVVIVGGNKRAGKTTLSMILHEKYNYNYYNFDMILDSLESSFPFLNDGNDDKYVSLLEELVKRSLDDVRNYNVSSVYEYIFTPDMLLNFKYISDVDIIFLANLDANESNIESDLKNYSNDYDWPTYATENDLDRNIKYILDNNQLLKEKCENYNFKLINTSRGERRTVILNEIAESIK